MGGTTAGVGTVVLDMTAASRVSQDDCAALITLHHSLAATGTRLRLAGAGTEALAGFAAGGLVEALGRGAIHSTLRSAVLAVCAEQPGPGLCTAQVRALLATPAEPLLP